MTSRSPGVVVLLVALLLVGCSSASLPASSGPDPELDAVRHFFETDAGWLARGMGARDGGGRVYCGVDRLGTSPDRRQHYLDLYCQEFHRSASGDVEPGTGRHGPVLATVTGSGAATTVISWRVPVDGAGYADDVRAMFPREEAGRVLRTDVRPVPGEAELRAAAERDLPVSRPMASTGR